MTPINPSFNTLVRVLQCFLKHRRTHQRVFSRALKQTFEKYALLRVLLNDRGHIPNNRDSSLLYLFVFNYIHVTETCEQLSML